VEVVGGDARPTIVFLHGTRLNAGQWATQISALGDEFRCVAIDLPGHGTRQDERFTLDAAAARVVQAIDDEAGGRAILVGLSLGGYVAIEVAAGHPDKVAGLVLAGTTAEPTGLRSMPYIGLALLLLAIRPSILARLNTWFFRFRYPPEIAEPIIAGGWGFRGGSVAVRSLVGREFAPRLARYPGRTLIVNGEFDLLFRLSERRFAREAASARRVTLPGATHLSNLDQPDRFSAAVRSFAARL
jgi:pimeloyl-ACP methyl ester carboxylesterase